MKVLGCLGIGIASVAGLILLIALVQMRSAPHRPAEPVPATRGEEVRQNCRREFSDPADQRDCELTILTRDRLRDRQEKLDRAAR
jgi:hypothetical protein